MELTVDYSQTNPINDEYYSSPLNSQNKTNLAQETIYRFLVDLVKYSTPEDLLQEFKNLFFDYAANERNSTVLLALSNMVLTHQEKDFLSTLKRGCYIIINNWNASRNYQYIFELVHSFTEFSTIEDTYTDTKIQKRLKFWLNKFVKSKDYEDLKVFSDKYDPEKKAHWSSRYTSYLLVPQYYDLNNPQEQRETAQKLARQLREKFKFDLAVYTIKSQSQLFPKKNVENPTSLGDEALNLIKKILVKKGLFNYVNLANIFMKQTTGSYFDNFKESLFKYLTYQINEPEIVKVLKVLLKDKLLNLYSEHNQQIIDSALLLRTCNKVISYLTTENQKAPSSLFVSLLSQNNPIILVNLLLKIMFICPHTKNHVEICIAELLEYYREKPESECQWLIHFMDILNITFSIHSENVEYNLIKRNGEKGNKSYEDNIDQYMIFSQMKSTVIQSADSAIAF